MLDSLRLGQFFVTTGEVLIPEFQRERQAERVRRGLEARRRRPTIRVELSWTFPLRFFELISGDGTKVYRERIDGSQPGAFDSGKLHLRPDLTGRTWVRLEAWDIAGNGAFTQPVWLGPAVR